MDAYTPPSTPTYSTTIDDPPHLLRMVRPRDAIQLSDPTSVSEVPGDDLDPPHSLLDVQRQLFP